MDISRGSRSRAPVRRSTTQQRHLLRFPYTAICGQQKTSTLDPSGAGSQSLRISLPKRFWPLTSAHVASLNYSQMVRNRRCWVCSQWGSIEARSASAQIGSFDPSDAEYYIFMGCNSLRSDSTAVFQEISQSRIIQVVSSNCWNPLKVEPSAGNCHNVARVLNMWSVQASEFQLASRGGPNMRTSCGGTRLSHVPLVYISCAIPF